LNDKYVLMAALFWLTSKHWNCFTKIWSTW